MFQMTLILIIMKIELKNKPKALFMLRFIIILLICFLPIQISLAKKPNETHPWAIVETLQGKATFNKKALKVNDMIRNKGVIKTQENSIIKIRLSQWKNSITIGPNSIMNLKLTHKMHKNQSIHKHFYTLVKGVCRWFSSPKNNNKQKQRLYTTNAIFGVRGTDYLVKANPLLNETEIIVFSGKVLFQNRTKKVDRKMISKNQWGGLGGRFGNKIGNILTLPKNIIQHFKQQLPQEK